MAIASTTGARVYIGPVNNTANDETAYAALSYTEVLDIESTSEFGDQASTIEFTALGDARVRKRKGVRNAGDMSMVVANNPLDTGQIALIAAEATEFTYAVKIVLADGADANDTDSVFYYRALVGSRRLGGLQANQIVKRTFAFYIDSAIVEVPSEAVA